MSTTVVIRLNVDNSGAVTKVRQVRDELEKVPGSAQKASTGLTTLKNALAAVGIAFSAVKIAQFFRDSLQAAKEEQETFVRLAATLGTLGVQYNSVSVELMRMFEGLQATTRFSDDEAAAAFQKLLIITGDYESAVKLLTVTMDTAIGTQRDLASTAETIGKAATGYLGILARNGIVIDQATQKQMQLATQIERTDMLVKILSERFGGQAKTDLQSYAAQMEQLGNSWQDLQEGIGATVISIAQWGGKLMSLQDVMAWWKDAILDFGQMMVTVFNVDYSKFFKAALLKIEAAFQLFVMHSNDALSKLPEWLGGRPEASHVAEQALARYLEIMREFGSATDAAFDDAITAGEEWRKRVENLTIETVELAAVTGGDGGGAAGGASLSDALLTAGASAERFNQILASSQDYLTQAAAAADRYMDILRGSGGMGSVYDAGAWSDNSWYWDSFSDAAEESFDYIGGMFSDMLGKGFMGELDSFADLWDEIWQDLAKSMVGIISDGFADAAENGWGRLQGIFDELKGNWAAGVAGLGMTAQAYQSGGGGWAGALMGAMGGAMAGAVFGPVGMAIGAVIGGVIGALGQAAENPETFVSNLGLDTGTIDTRGHQGYTTELRDLWIKQQQGIMRSYISAYRDVLRLFEDESLFDLIGVTPEFSTDGWMGMGADSLAQYLEQEFWPAQFMNMFRDAISAGLEGFGVTNATISQLWTELEALPGEDRMGALTTYVSSLVGLSDLMAEMDWNAILDAVGQDSLTQFMAGMEEIAHSIDVLMYAMDDMTLLERAEQAQEIEQLITQVRQAEIQYLQQLDSLQQGINDSIASMIEQFQLADMGPGQQQAYYQQRIAEIMATLAGGGVTSPEQLQQLMAELQGYIQALAQGLGDQLFEPMDIMGWGQTWVDYLTGILQEAQGYSDAYFEQFRDEIRAANDELIDALRDLIDALTDFGGEAGEGAGGGAGNPNPYVPEGAVYNPSVNVYLEGSMSALRPFVRAEIRDSMAGRSRGIN